MYLRASYFLRKKILATILSDPIFKKTVLGVNNPLNNLYILQAQNEIVFDLSRSGQYPN